MSKTRIFISIKKVCARWREFNYYSPLIHLIAPPQCFQTMEIQFCRVLLTTMLYHRDTNLHSDEAFIAVEASEGSHLK